MHIQEKNKMGGKGKKEKKNQISMAQSNRTYFAKEECIL